MLSVLKKRVDFLGVFQNCILYRKKTIIIQMCLTEIVTGNETDDNSPIFVGITASRKVGNAVHRNRAKRRLRVCARTLLTHEMHFSQAFLKTLHLKKINLSKKTLNVFLNKSGARAEDTLKHKKLGLVIVFIATKYTPDVKWSLLVTEVQDAMNRCLKNSVMKKAAFDANMNVECGDAEKYLKKEDCIVKLPYPAVVMHLESCIKNEKNFVFRDKIQHFLKKITYFTTDNK